MVHALLQTLKAHPRMNAHLTSDELCIYDRVKLGMMLPTGAGVMMACLNDAGAKSLGDLATALQDLRQRARTGRFDLAETRGATFMVAGPPTYSRSASPSTIAVPTVLQQPVSWPTSFVLWSIQIRAAFWLLGPCKNSPALQYALRNTQ